jgi:Fic family protein
LAAQFCEKRDLLYWPEFEFDFRLDVPRLLPHLAAIEACHEAVSNRVLPPPWRESAGQETAKSTNGQPAQDSIAPGKELYANAPYNWIRKRFSPGGAPLSVEDILQAHRLVACEPGAYSSKPGAWRSYGVQVGRRESGGMHLGAPVERLPALMSRYVGYINRADVRGLPPAVHALVAHFLFTTIHPFDDGNGRVCRLIAAGILFQRGYNGHGFYALSNHFYLHEVRYHSLLQQCWQNPLPFDLTGFVAFGIEGLVAELQGVNNFLRVKLHRTADGSLVHPAHG